MTFEERINYAKKNSTKFINEHVDELFFDATKDDFESLLCILTACSVNKDLELFNKISAYIESLQEFGINHYHTYVYHEASMVHNRSARDLESALNHGVKAHTLAHELNNHEFIINSTRYISTVYFRNNDIDMAIYYIKRAIDLIKEEDHPDIKAETYMIYGVLLFETNEYEHAKMAYEKSLFYYQQVEGFDSTVYYYKLMLNLGEVSMHLGNLSVAEMFFNRAVRLGEKHGYENSLNSMYLTLAEFYKKQGNFESAFSVLDLYIKKMQTIIGALGSRPGYNALSVKNTVDQIGKLKHKNDSLMKRLTKLHGELQYQNHANQSDDDVVEQIEQALHDKEIHAFYQFKWSVKSDRPVGAEALVRWIKNDQIISPGLFIGQVEQSDTIIALSNCVMRQAMMTCKQIVEKEDSDFVMSINITPFQLMNQDLAYDIEKALIIHNLPAKNFEIEITERSFIEQNPKIIDELYKVKALGVKISLDDFGTGYSSLACINELPIDIIKIDQSLIRDLSSEKRARKLIKGLIEMMHSIDLIVVAEGVETMIEVETLSNLNCDELQGYFYSRPTDQKSFVDMLCNKLESSICV